MKEVVLKLKAGAPKKNSVVYNPVTESPTNAVTSVYIMRSALTELGNPKELTLVLRSE